MGSGQTKSSQNGVEVTMDHPNFTNAIWVTEAGSKRIQTTMSVDNASWTKWKKNLSSLSFSDQFILLPKSDQYESKGMCGNAGLLKLKYESFPYLLKEQIEKRAERKQPFQENDLWFLSFCLLAAQKEAFSKTGSKLGDVRPSNIFINEEGQIKVASQWSWPQELTNCGKTLEKQQTYLSPKELSRVSMNQSEDYHDTQSEMWSIGLTILSAALLIDCAPLYNLKELKLNWDQYDRLMFKWKSTPQYSQIFRSFVSNLISIEPEKRMTLPQAWNFISAHQIPIYNKQNFVVNNAPHKLHEQIMLIQAIFGLKPKAMTNLDQRISINQNMQPMIFQGIPVTHSNLIVPLEQAPLRNSMNVNLMNRQSQTNSTQKPMQMPEQQVYIQSQNKAPLEGVHQVRSNNYINNAE